MVHPLGSSWFKLPLDQPELAVYAYVLQKRSSLFYIMECKRTVLPCCDIRFDSSVLKYALYLQEGEAQECSSDRFV